MTTSQQLMIRLSEIREKLNQVNDLENPTEEQRAERDRLTAEYPEIEKRFRAAVIVESKETEQRDAGNETGGAGRETGEGAELRRLQRTARLGRYLEAAVGGVALDGAESELLDALEVRNHHGVVAGAVQIPWTLLAEPEPEARAATTSAAYDGPTRSMPILDRLFGKSILGDLGVMLQSVPAGMSEWPLVTAGATPAQAAESAAAPSQALRLAPTGLRPLRLAGRMGCTVEASATIPGLEAAMRKDLRAAVEARMSELVLTGDGSGANPTGFYNKIAAPDDPGAVAEFAEFAGMAAQAIDGLHAYREGEVAVTTAVDVYQSMAAAYLNPGVEAAVEVLERRARNVTATSFAPAAVGGISKATILHAGAGGAGRGDSLGAMWPTMQVIRDPYTDAASGTTWLTWTVLWNVAVAHRAGAYKRIALKLA